MADAHGSQAGAMKSRLLASGERFSFSQAYRLLRLLAHREGAQNPSIKVRPNLSLDFPGNDLSEIREVGTAEYRLTANFLGLYGVTSPLPTFYTEDLLDEQHEGRHSNRDFLDIISQTIYPLFFRAWLKSRAHIRIKEFDDRRLLEIFHTFVGVNRPLRYMDRPGVAQLLRFAGLFSQYPRSAMGLQTIVAALYPGTHVDIIQQDERWQSIPQDQRTVLGGQACILGEDAHLGSQVKCRSGNLTLRITEVGSELFLKLLPGGEEFAKLRFIVRYYLLDPLHIHLKIGLKPDVARPLPLGGTSWASLGRDSWLMSEDTAIHGMPEFTL